MNCYIDPVRPDRIGVEKPQISFELPQVGTVRPRGTGEITSSNWLLGCETLDRDYTDYDQYKEYLCPLGISTIRLQGGWAKTERERGVYDWAWLDHIVEDAVRRGLRPWLQTGYGNPIYPGAGGSNLGAGMPLSEEGLTAYEHWVSAMATRYRDKVRDWEVWNEPNFGDNKVNTPEITAEFNIRTASIIKAIQPDARISALAIGHIDLEFTERFFRYLLDHQSCGLFHNVTYHDYVYNPDANELAVWRFRQIVEQYAPNLILRQGENGAPSVGRSGGALFDYDWSELSQAKWDTRRMLDNLGHDIQCSVYSIAEIQYDTTGPITTANTKGLLATDARKRVLRPKIAYHAVQHVTAIFDDTLERIHETTFRHTICDTDTGAYWYSTDQNLAVYGYRHRETGNKLYTVWNREAIPGDDCSPRPLDFAFVGSSFQEPVLVDIVTGNIYAIPAGQRKHAGNIDRFYDIPVYDAPILLAERSLIPYL